MDYEEGAFGTWTYELTKPPPPPIVNPVIGQARAVPAQPVAGKGFKVVFPVTRRDTGGPLATGTLSCTTKAAGRVVPHRHTFQAGRARVTLAVPKAAKGKQLRIAVEVTADKAATKVFTFKIR